MGVEIVGTDMAQVAAETKRDIDNSFLHENENGKMDKDSGFSDPIKLSHEEEPVKGETNNVSDSNLPKDAVDEWPAAKQVHIFYFVKHQRYDDPEIRARIELADKEIQKRNQSRFQITEKLRAKRSERADLKAQVKTLIADIQKYRAMLGEKKKELGPLQQALDQLRSNNSSGRGGLCSSEEELNDLIYSLQYRIQHESIPLSEEKQIVREIKQLEGTREKVIGNAAIRAKIEESLGQKEAIQDQVKLMGSDLFGVRKEYQAVQSKINDLDGKVKVLDEEIESLQSELAVVTKKRDEVYDSIKELRAQRDEGNALYFQSRSLIIKARELQAKKDVKALEELSHSEVEKFMSLWISKSFRDDYEKRSLPSLDTRQLSRDARIRNPDEEPSEQEPVTKDAVKRSKEDSKPAPQKESLPTQKVKKEAGKKDSTAALEKVDADDKVTSEVETQQQKPAEEKVVDEAKLKELKREEEIVKAKQAMERKKKLAEKAASKAAVKAQKEAEKKLKEREKKLKKKAGASAPASDPEELAEAVAEAVAEPETVDASEESLAPPREKFRIKEKTVRYRNRPRGGDPLPKAILKRRKSTNYWMWAAVVAAALLVLLFLVLCYFYMF